MKNLNLRLLLAAMLFVSSLFFSQVVRADGCPQEECGPRNDGCYWCCDLKLESTFLPKCRYWDTQENNKCRKDRTSCPTNDEDGSGPGGFLP